MDVKSVRFVRSAAQWRGLAEDGLPEVAFVGRSNVGKSSLVNMLVGRRALAHTSRTPGKTQLFNYYCINERFYLIDVPGFGYARVARTQREQWQRFIGRYLVERDVLRLVIHLVDSRHPPTALDKEVMLLMKQSNAAYVIALTKVDKLSGNARIQSMKTVKNVLEAQGLSVPVVETSSQDGRGRQALLQWISDLLV
jgi:GTP-binding protein